MAAGWEWFDFMRLENTTSRQAFIDIWLERNESLGKWRVRHSWGPLGKGSLGEKVTGEMSREFADSNFWAKIKDKEKRGYVKVNQSSSRASVTARVGPQHGVSVGQPATGLAPTELLDVDDEDHTPEGSIFDKKKEWSKQREARRMAAPWGSAVKGGRR